MIDTKNSPLSEQDITDLSGFFDMLAKFDFEDMKISGQSGHSQEVNKDFSFLGGESLLGSCEQGEQIS